MKAKENWNESGYFSGITEDYSNYTWYKGENLNPYKDDDKRPLAARFWEYEKEFHMAFLDRCDTKADLKKEYAIWKKELLEDHLPGESPNPYGDNTDWFRAFKNGKK
jgi:hypothetical protein